MKKYITAMIISITALGLLTGCGSKDIGKEEATQIALKDAGFSESDVTRLYVSKDRDDGTTIYDIGFSTENTEYEYEVKASNGDIISASAEEIKQNTSQTQAAQSDQNTQTEQPADTNQNQSNQNTGNQSSTGSDVQISQEEAVRLALERVSGATEQDLRIELDYDDGYYRYEGDIIYNQTEYEFEIDANTGEFLEWSEEKH